MPRRGFRVIAILVVALSAWVLSAKGWFDRPGDFASPPNGAFAAAPASPASSPSSALCGDDLLPPVTTAVGADGRWRRTAAKVVLTATDKGSGVAATWFQVDEGPWTAGTTVVVPASKDHTSDGEHTIAFYSVDNCRNAESARTVVVRIDTRPPRLRWVDLAPAKVRRLQTVRCRLTVCEANGPVRVALQVKTQYGRLVLRRAGVVREPGSWSVAFAPRTAGGDVLLPGVYRVRATATDAAGNVRVSGTRSFRVFGPASTRVWRRVDGVGRRVALTFDDGDVGAWKAILATLKAGRAHATFFVLGPFVSGSPHLARRTLAEGHAIGSHGYTHALMTRESAAEVCGELERSSRPWWAAARATPMPYLRPPYGIYDRRTLAVARSAGFARIVLWDVDPEDWRSPGAGVIAQRVLRNVRPGSIVLLHLRPQTAAALPAILRGLRARGYKVVSLPELFRAAGYQ